tara:strand:+ start:77 stop:532 length:456 start_codon:yes stop_codon:yes gene_type:complete
MGYGILKFDTLTTSDSKSTSVDKSIDTSYVFNGSAKHFTMYNQDADTVKESFNQSTISDNAAGDFTTNFTNTFGNVVYCSVGMTENGYTTQRGQNGLAIDTQLDSSDALTNGTALATNARDYRTKYGSRENEAGGYSDQAPVMLLNIGDLA